VCAEIQKGLGDLHCTRALGYFPLYLLDTFIYEWLNYCINKLFWI
jgi:hypothetical protein